MTHVAPLVAAVAHARDVRAPERLAFAERLRATIADRALILETCHRVEAYVADAADVDRLAALDLPAGARLLEGEAVVRHAIALAVGRDSVVVGEDQVLHQVRVDVARARTAGRLHPALERTFAEALRAGRRARSWRTGPERSLATTALAVVERQRGSVAGHGVLVVGAGRMAGVAARGAAAAHAVVSVADRTPAAARALATAVGGRPVAFDPGPAAGDVAAILVALGGPWPIAVGTTRAIADGRAVVVDLSVPSAVPAGLADRLGSRLVTIDDLARAPDEADAGPTDGRALRRLDDLIGTSTASVMAWLETQDGRAAAAELARRADDARQAELEILWRRLPALDPAARAAIDAMTQHFAERLFRDALERLGRDPDGRAEQAARELFAL